MKKQAKPGKETFGLIIGTRAYFNSELAIDVRKTLLEELDKAGYVVADETTRTNLPGVFAIGDVRTKALRQVVTAAADGAVASYYADEYLAEGY